MLMRALCVFKRDESGFRAPIPHHRLIPCYPTDVGQMSLQESCIIRLNVRWKGRQAGIRRNIIIIITMFHSLSFGYILVNSHLIFLNFLFIKSRQSAFKPPTTSTTRRSYGDPQSTEASEDTYPSTGQTFVPRVNVTYYNNSIVYIKIY